MLEELPESARRAVHDDARALDIDTPVTRANSSKEPAALA